MGTSLASSGVEIPETVRHREISLEERLKEAAANGDYSAADYLTDLDRLGSEVSTIPGLAAALKDKGGKMSEDEAFMELAARFHGSGERLRAEELLAWYGRQVTEVSQETVDGYVKKYGKEGPKLPLKGTRWTGRGGPLPLSVLPEHREEEFVTAWEVWMMAPPSAERSCMDVGIGTGLAKHRREQMIPLMQLNGDIRLAGKKNIPAQTEETLHIIRGLDMTPGDLAIGAILERCRRAMVGGYSGAGYNGTMRQAVRTFSSWSLTADLMGDRQKGPQFDPPYPQTPEEVPRTGDHWKIYKPLIEARLKNGANLSKDDRAILEEAMRLMPKE